jgi:hypothetical protein
MLPTVRLHVASYNTKRSTELCVRSIREYAGYPFELTVGDSGSTDGSLELLESFEREGWLTLEQFPGRQHAQWIDHWLARCDENFAVFIDSDVEFLRQRWLRELVESAVENDAVLVSGEWVPEAPDFIEPVGGKAVRLSGRPAPWLLLLRASEGRQIGTSFAFTAVETDTVHEGLIAYDVGACFSRRLSSGGMGALIMPRTYRRAFHHYGGLSWRGAADGASTRRRRELDSGGSRLVRLRASQEALSPAPRR